MAPSQQSFLVLLFEIITALYTFIFLQSTITVGNYSSIFLIYNSKELRKQRLLGTHVGKKKFNVSEKKIHCQGHTLSGYQILILPKLFYNSVH